MLLGNRVDPDRQEIQQLRITEGAQPQLFGPEQVALAQRVEHAFQQHVGGGDQRIGQRAAVEQGADLIDLLPLRQTFAARNIAPPPALLNAIDRMMPMLRFFRHGDGTFALFNGMSSAPQDLVATLLAYDDTHGVPMAQRLFSIAAELDALPHADRLGYLDDADMVDRAAQGKKAAEQNVHLR